MVVKLDSAPFIKAEKDIVPTTSLMNNAQQNQDIIYCTQTEYVTQATKVSKIRTDLKTTKVRCFKIHIFTHFLLTI